MMDDGHIGNGHVLCLLGARLLVPPLLAFLCMFPPLPAFSLFLFLVGFWNGLIVNSATGEARFLTILFLLLFRANQLPTPPSCFSLNALIM